MGKASVRLSVDAIEHFDTVVAVPGESAAAEFSKAAHSSSPIRVGVGTRGSTDFVGALVDTLVSLGLQPAQAERFLAAVLIAPTIAMKDAFGPGVLQSVLVRDADEDHSTRVTLRGHLEPNPRGGTFTNASLMAEPFDPNSMGERASLVTELAVEALNYPVPARTGGRALGLALIGNPSRLGLVESEHSWNDVLKSTARALNVDLDIRTSLQSLKDALPASIDTMVLFDPSLESALRSTNPEASPVAVDCSGRELNCVVRDIAELVLTVLESKAVVVPVDGQRRLVAGDKFFHRKVGTSAAFDRFGDPCKPCAHDSFERYFRAVKAEKGMARLYENFKPDMLYHCSKGYNCGVYAVFAPANL